MAVRAKYITFTERDTPLQVAGGYYANGADNQYPQQVDSIINASVTASRCIGELRKAIALSGVSAINNHIVNKFKKLTFWTLFRKICTDISRQGGVFLHINYNAEYKIVSVDVLPYTSCRLGKKDDTDYSGKILFSPNWLDEKNLQSFDVFNPDKEVIQYQVEKSGGWKKYKGQVLYYSGSAEIYPLAPIDPALRDADCEAQAAIYRNISLRKGFFGKQVVVTPPLVDEQDITSLNDEELAAYNKKLNDSESFTKALKKFVGASNADGLLHLQTALTGDTIDEVIKFIDISPKIKDGLFQYTEKASAKNISRALSVPAILINIDEQSVFGNSGELLKEAKRTLVESQNEQRKDIERDVLTPIFTRFAGLEIDNLQIDNGDSNSI